MFYHIRGELVYVDSAFAVIDASGVGYKLSISLNTYNEISKEVGREIRLLTHLQVREDAVELYGFYTSEELECFKLLTSVSGVGPKASMSILSLYTPDRFAYAVCTEDSRALAKASGIGAKTAARIVLELKDKISKDAVSGTPDVSSKVIENAKVSSGAKNGKLSEACDALTVLGYNRSEILDVLRTIDPQLELEEIITQALKKFASK
ncbi:MAG: Holliday junction branch migration protein RuvA [Clostridia bacterium]|jgi:Holliday junction DNA helicase RuvA|nr:Holliday junction branch migration protein RuvA [Clostridia bacterium]